MHILITGAAGMIGRKLVGALAQGRASWPAAPSRALDLHDIVAPETPAAPGIAVAAHTGDLAAAGAGEALLAGKPDIVFHLAGIVSGEAESNFDLGYRVNLDGTRALFDAVRLAGHGPRVVYTSSIAVFGAPFPDVIYDDFQQTPLTSYGTQKLIGELILADYTRRGFFDGVGIRLPTICVRPGKPNKAASSFFSGIIREPLAGQEALLPVPRTVMHTHASPRSAVNFLIHAAGIDGAAIGPRRNLTMPGVGVTVGEQIEVAAPHCRRRCRQADPRRARRDGLEDRAELADPLRGETRAGAGLCRRAELRRDRPRAYRGRAGRQGCR